MGELNYECPRCGGGTEPVAVEGYNGSVEVEDSYCGMCAADIAVEEAYAGTDY